MNTNTTTPAMPVSTATLAAPPAKPYRVELHDGGYRMVGPRVCTSAKGRDWHPFLVDIVELMNLAYAEGAKSVGRASIDGRKNR